ncbi:hypothetical protein L228DRAFT_269270 [Xylona heveae TC161]|uniref:DUF7702 domain-containing protein n=1 Tax=Xylona heveae (strain CBS 132557 / TC161) TaxID=1328760 RepID=A0A165G734_XYLHT|nr:hypothetical protein L228DRAFT_269270 [Xylona heveae TC161]KZF21816.1 hypothetical protein L228DRAFT_269270 [Xylona heveae TC161]
MTITTRGRLAIAEIVYYAPALVLAVIVMLRHGFRRQLGWIYLAILALVRIIGSSMQIASEQDPSNTGLITTAAILSSVGLSPLLLAMAGLLKRVDDSLPSSHRLPGRTFTLLHIPTLVALILAITGGSEESSSPTSNNGGRKFMKIAIIIFLVVYVIQSALTFLTLFKLRHVPQGERKLVYAVTGSIPFLAVRLLYSLIGAFESPTKLTFNTVVGNVFVQAFMAVLEEFVIVAMYLAAGLLVAKLSNPRDGAGAGPETSEASSTSSAAGDEERDVRDNVKMGQQGAYVTVNGNEERYVAQPTQTPAHQQQGTTYQPGYQQQRPY